MKHIIWMKERRNSYKILGRKPEWKSKVRDTGTQGRIILILILKN
jgi:hypothetical protein